MTRYCFVVSLKAQPSWLKLPREERNANWADVARITKEFRDRVSFNYHDADAFDGRYSDLVICETAAIIDYHHMWDHIKDTRIFANDYYQITDVRMGIRGVSHGD